MHIFKLFSSKSPVFPSAIKMQLVAEFQALTNPNAILKATKLQAIQAQFLSSSETALI